MAKPLLSMFVRGEHYEVPTVAYLTDHRDRIHVVVRYNRGPTLVLWDRRLGRIIDSPCCPSCKTYRDLPARVVNELVEKLREVA